MSKVASRCSSRLKNDPSKFETACNVRDLSFEDKVSKLAATILNDDTAKFIKSKMDCQSANSSATDKTSFL